MEISKLKVADTTKVTEFLDCGICLELLKKTAMVKNCGHVFCRECVDKYIVSKLGSREYWDTGLREVNCPYCRKQFDSEDVIDMPLLDRLINSIIMECNCGVSQPVGLWRTSAHTCSFYQKCDNIGCDALIRFDDKVKHKTECEFTRLKCRKCRGVFNTKDYKSHKLACKLKFHHAIVSNGNLPLFVIM